LVGGGIASGTDDDDDDEDNDDNDYVGGLEVKADRKCGYDVHDHVDLNFRFYSEF